MYQTKGYTCNHMEIFSSLFAIVWKLLNIYLARNDNSFVYRPTNKNKSQYILFPVQTILIVTTLLLCLNY